jgi:TerC family integral membrane protein
MSALMSKQILWWIAFIIFVVGMLALDLGVFHRRSHAVKVREALLWSLMWIALALLFNLGVFWYYGHQAGIQFLTGYLVEKSLSVDNLFVFLLIFNYFQVPSSYQHKVLFWGIFGALIMRGIFIFAGIALIQKFHWVLYLMGVFLVLTGIKLVFEKEKEIYPEKNPLLRLFRKLMPVTSAYEGDRFFVKRDLRYFATPLFIVLLVIETTDVIFAVDSVPAVLAISLDPFIVFSSNIFAILGLRALYFALSGMMAMFHHLHYGLSAILVFVGIKMLVAAYYEIPILWALAFIGVVLAISIVASIIWPHPEEVIPISAELPEIVPPKNH